MRHWKLASTAILCAAQAIGPAQAQLPTLPGVTGGLPGISSISPGDAAGLLGYCLKNKYLGGANAESVAKGLLKKPGISSSPDFAAGQAGKILNGQAAPVSLDKVPNQLKATACNMVLKKGAGL